MLCSPDELGLGTEHDGIMTLTVDVPPGTPFLEAMPIGDVRFDVDVLPNRGDLLSHHGVAREIAALTGTPLRTPAELGTPLQPAIAYARGDATAASGGAVVRLEDPDGCPRYLGLVVRGVTVGPSPEWLVNRLASVGVRSISNIVDVTNYFVHGFGHPMHAFDLSRLASSTIVIRRATAGERIVTLDGVERILSPEMTVIADASRAVAIGGVMGGRDSEVTAATTDIFLEVATFSPTRVRATRRALGMSTDASYRYERGVDAAGLPRALELAAQLLVQVSGGRIDGAAIDTGAMPGSRRPVAARATRISRLLGDSVSGTEIARLLESIGFTVKVVDDDQLEITPPTWRTDVARDADIVEEVARLRGYDVLSDELREFRPGTVPDHPLHTLGRRVRGFLAAAGLSETRPLPFVRGDDATHVRVRNPLADDEPHLRISLLETLARRAEYNLTRMQGNVRLFEIGSAFQPSGRDLPDETVRVGVLVMGARAPRHFTEPSPPAYDVWDVKALGEALVRVIFPDETIAMSPGTGDTLWRIEGRQRGTLGVIARLSLDRPAWATDAFGVEIVCGRLPNEPVAPPGAHAHAVQAPPRARAAVRYRPLPTTPPAEFDLALLLPEGMHAADVERAIRAASGELLESIELFDEYRGAGVAKGFRSVAWRLTFRDPARTLRDKEIEGRRQKILRSLEGELGVRPRTA
jgi:phenylalanyl-tRNA synthetase beta chain